MEQEVYLLYETDAWNSMDSRVLMGVFTTDENLLNGVRKLAREELEKDINAFRAYDDCEEPTKEEIAAMAEEQREELYDMLVEDVIEEFTRNNLQTQSFDTNYDTETATLDKLGEV